MITLPSYNRSLIKSLFFLVTVLGLLNVAAVYAEGNKTPMIEEITVTGTYTTRSMNDATGLNLSLRETPQSVSIITQQMIKDKALVNMASVLKHTPGVAMVGDTSEGHQIFVRGFKLDASVQIDGMITTTANSSRASAISQGIDPVIAERVEVLKGAAGILSGLGEPSATVNMIRKRPTEPFQASVSSSMGRWDTYRTELDLSGALTVNGEIRGRLVAAYQDGDSHVDRYARKKNVVYGVVAMDLAPATELSLAVDHFKTQSTGVYSWNSIPAYYTDGSLTEFSRSFSLGQNWSYQDVDEASVMPELRHEFNNGWQLTGAYRYSDASIDGLSASLGEYIDKTTGDLVQEFPGYEALHSDGRSKTHSFNLYTSGEFPLLGRDHELVAGYSYNKNTFSSVDRYAAISPPNIANTAVPLPVLTDPAQRYFYKDTQTQTGLYTTARFKLRDTLTLMMGGRLSSWALDSAAGSGAGNSTDDPTHAEDDNIVTPYVGVVYDLNDYASVYASYTGIFMPVVHYNADAQLLEPTEGTSTEAGVKLAFFDDDLNVSAAVYQSNKDNVAEPTPEDLPDGRTIYESIDGIKTDGYEVEVSGALTPAWNISGGYTHNTAKDKTGELRQTYIPDTVFKLTTRYNLGGRLQGLTLGGGVRWQSSTHYSYTINVVDPEIPFTQKQPAYALVDMMARYAISNTVTLGLNINNLLDKTYNRSLWGFSDYGEPRNAMLSLAWQL